jgi:hypothetical protein
MGHYCATVGWKLSSTIVNGFVHNIELQSNERNRDILLLFQLLWFANRAALEAMEQSLPPRPTHPTILKCEQFGPVMPSWTTAIVQSAVTLLLFFLPKPLQIPHQCQNDKGEQNEPPPTLRPPWFSLDPSVALVCFLSNWSRLSTAALTQCFHFQSSSKHTPYLVCFVKIEECIYEPDSLRRDIF